MRPPPVVTGISPAEGPPGTRVIIRGENLGLNAKDVVGLTICGANCLLSADYKSASKIIARTGKAKPGKGDVNVTTKSGGEGSCTVQFKLQTVIPDPLRESAVWIEEVDLEELRASSGSARPVSPQLTISHDPLGIASDIFGYGGYPEDKLEELYPEGTGNILAENFHPAWFLLEKHFDTRFDTLKNGLNYLKHEESRRATGPLAFVKDNIATFLDALDTLRDVQRKMLKDESACEGGSIAEKLESILQGASKNADALFQDVLSRKDDADRTRNALNVLQRFRFLFSLPQSIERNIKQGDYEMVISDYARAKSLFAETDIKIFKKVLQEVETKIEGFRLHLKNKLHDLPTPPEEQKKYIRYLVELDSPGDPTWECLTNQHEWIIKLLTSCNDDHISKDAAPLLQVDSSNDIEVHARAPSPSLTTGMNRADSHSRSYPSLFSPPPYRSSSLDRQGKGNHTSPQRVLFVEELSEILTETLPDLWQLGQDYFSGTIMDEDSSNLQKHVTPASGKQSQFEVMMKEITKLYSTFVRAAFFPSSRDSKSSSRKTTGMWQSSLEGIGAWLPSCVRSIKTCLDSLTPLSLPAGCLVSVQTLTSDMKALCMAELFRDAVDEITSLHCNELWNLEKDERGGRITSLPLLFENTVMETVHVLKEISSDADAEETKEQSMRKRVVEYFKEMLQAFKECLHHLAFQPDQDSDKTSISSGTLDTMPSHGSLHHSVSLCSTTDDVPVIDERLLIILNNCRYVRERVLPRLVENFRKREYPITDAVKEELHLELSGLESKIFDAYIDQKGEPLTQALETGMYAGGFKWHDCLPPQDIRSYIKEIIMNLVMVHAQVFLISAELLPRVLSRLTDLLAEEFKRLLQSTSKGFTSAGTVTAHLETRAIQETLAAYMTSQSREAFQDAMTTVPQITKDSDKRLIETLMAKFKRRLRFQLECFQVDMEEL